VHFYNNDYYADMLMHYLTDNSNTAWDFSRVFGSKRRLTHDLQSNLYSKIGLLCSYLINVLVLVLVLVLATSVLETSLRKTKQLAKNFYNYHYQDYIL